MSTSLCEQLPYWEFGSEPIPHMILWDGSISAAIELLPLDIECFDEVRVNQLTEQMRAFVNSLPEGLTAQFIVKVESDYADLIERHRALVATENRFLKELDEARCEKLMEEAKSGSIFRPRLFLFFKTESPVKPRLFSISALKKFSNEFGNGFEILVENLAQVLENAEATLSSIGFSATRLDRCQLVELAYQHLNPRRAQDIAPPEVRSPGESVEGESPRAQLALSDLTLDQGDFVLDQQRVRVLSLRTLPRSHVCRNDERLSHAAIQI